MIKESQKLTADHFNANAPQWRDLYTRTDVYARMYQHRRDIVLKFVDSLPLSGGESALEVGCGPGLTTVALRRRGYAVIALDAAPAMIKLTQQLASESGVTVGTVVGDTCGLPFVDRAFKLVVAVGVTEWVGDLEVAIGELARVVAADGHLIVTTDSRWALYRLIDPVLNPVLDPIKRLLRRSERKPRPTVYSLRHFNAALKRAGLHRIAGVTVGFGPFSVLKFPLFPDSLAIRVHEKLQRVADGGALLLRAGGHVYAVIARR
ncbi:MAG: class I SAM-dependent methyltransferase [Acidobacteriota bacterium]|nr:class I SAM-dependent methyltransferase [Acidobacteriota bacterium]